MYSNYSREELLSNVENLLNKVSKKNQMKVCNLYLKKHKKIINEESVSDSRFIISSNSLSDEQLLELYRLLDKNQ